MKKIFILTGEPSGDKLASKVISKFKSTRSDIQYLSVGGEYLKGLGIKSLYDLKEITFLQEGRHLHIRFRATTGEAMGMNMVGKGSNFVLRYLKKQQ